MQKGEKTMRKGSGFCVYEKKHENFILRSFIVSVNDDFTTLFYSHEKQIYPEFKDMSSMTKFLISLAEINDIEIPHYNDFGVEIYLILFFKSVTHFKKENYNPVQFINFRD